MPAQRIREWQMPAASPRRSLPHIPGRWTSVPIGPCCPPVWLPVATPALLLAEYLAAYPHSSDSDRDSFFPDSQDGQERFLWDFDTADRLHPFLPFFLFFQQFPFPRDVAAVALGCHVFLHRPDGLPGDDFVPYRCLNGDFKHLPRNQLFH